MGFFTAGIHWVSVSIINFGGMPIAVAALLVVLLCAYLSLYPTLCAYLLNRLTPKPGLYRYFVAFPALWLITDWLRGWVLTGFPWLQLGYSQMDNPLIGFAPVLGVEGVTFAMTLIVASIYYLATQKKLLMPLVITTLLFGAGYYLQSQQWTTTQPAKTVALVQGNTPQAEKWLPDQRDSILDNYLQLSLKNDDADIIIWPESAIPALEFQVEPFLDQTAALMAQSDTTLLTGIINYKRKDFTDEYYNAVIVLGKPNTSLDPAHSSESPVSNHYYKNKLLPIGEFVPFEDLLRPLAPLFNLPMSSFQRGGEHQPNLRADGVNIATAICYEIAFNQTLVNTVDENTGYILTVSNDAWFGRSIAAAQHLEIARMRAFEFQRPVLRSTNTGISAVYNARGQELGRTAQFETTVLRAEVAPTQGMTPFNHYGNTPMLILMFAMLGVVLLHQGLQKRAQTEKSTLLEQKK